MHMVTPKNTLQTIILTGLHSKHHYEMAKQITFTISLHFFFGK